MERAARAEAGRGCWGPTGDGITQAGAGGASQARWRGWPSALVPEEPGEHPSGPGPVEGGQLSLALTT